MGRWLAKGVPSQKVSRGLAQAGPPGDLGCVSAQGGDEAAERGTEPGDGPPGPLLSPAVTRCVPVFRLRSWGAHS